MNAKPPLAQKACCGTRYNSVELDILESDHLDRDRRKFRVLDNALAVDSEVAAAAKEENLERERDHDGYCCPKATAEERYKLLHAKLEEKILSFARNVALPSRDGYYQSNNNNNTNNNIVNRDIALTPKDAVDVAGDTSSSEEPSAIFFALEAGPRDQSYSLQEELKHQSRKLCRSFSPSPSPGVKLSSTTRSGRSQGSYGVSSSRSQTQPAASAARSCSAPRCNSVRRREELRPMNKRTVYAEDLTGAELLAILRMRHIIQSLGETEEYKLPATRCHRMLLTEEERRQVYLLRDQLARRSVADGRSSHTFRESTATLRGPAATLRGSGAALVAKSGTIVSKVP